jgi:hypothetical protein
MRHAAWVDRSLRYQCHKGRQLRPDTTRIWAAHHMTAKFVIRCSGRTIGLVFDYERAIEDAHTKVTALLQEEATSRGVGIIAAALFSDWLFQSPPLRKIYLDVYGFNERVTTILRKLNV